MSRHTDYTPALYESPNADADNLGPAMRELNQRQRAVVYYLLDTGTDSWSEAAREAGYSHNGSEGGLRVTAHRLRHDPRMAAALVEEGRRRPAYNLGVYFKTMDAIARDPAHKDALKAATTLAAMVGVSPISISKTETHVHHHTDAMDDVRAAAAILGVDPEALMRGRLKDVTPRPAQIEHQPPVSENSAMTIEDARAALSDLL